MSAADAAGPGTEFRVLGPLEVVIHGHAVEVGGPMRRRLLVGLLTRPGRTVSSDGLIDLLWGDLVPDDAANSLSTHVSRLRGDLRAVGGNALTRIEHRHAGYALVVADGAVDAARFEALVGEARRALHDAPADAEERLEVALGLWHGRAFGEFADVPYIRPEAQRLEELRRTAMEDLFDAALAVGRHHEIVGELQRFVAREPFRERPRRQLMLALHRSGRRADALRVYRSFRDELDHELGLAPSADLQRLERDILRDAPALRPARAGAEEQRAPRAPVRLPRPPSRLVGRDEDVVAVRDLLAASRLVTLVGAGGVGKTRLALATAPEVEGRYDDGVAWCALDEVEQSGVGAALALAVGVRQRPERSIEASLLEALRSVELLLVVDNCEHVVDEAAPLLASLIRTCPRVTVLATSRERLSIDGEHLWHVEPLAVPAAADDPSELAVVPAVQLLAERARAVSPGFAVTADNAGAVASICTRLDGVPLALELAAAWLRTMSAAEVDDRLDDRLRLLAAERRTAGGRHQTLWAVAAWSYDLLTDAQRQVFDRLSVFVGGFTLDAAEVVASGGHIDRDDVADLLAGLVDTSMVMRAWSGPVTRYRVLEFLRRFGRVRLERRGDDGRHRQRHARWFVDVAERTEHALRGAAEADAVAAIDVERANLRAAQHWLQSVGDVDGALRLWVALAPYALFRLNDEMLAWARQALAMPGAGTHPRYGRACALAAFCSADTGRRRQAAELAETALRHVASDEPAARHGILALGVVDLLEGRLGACLRRSGESRELADAVDDRWWAALSALHEVLALAYGGDVDAALARAEVQRRLAEASRNPTQIAWSLYTRGEVLLDRDPARARSLLSEAVEVARSVRNQLVEGVALVSLTSLRAREGPPAEALRSFEEVIGRWRRSGDRTHLWTTLRTLAELFARLGHDDAAAVLVAAARTDATAAPAYGPQGRRLDEVEAVLADRLGDVRFRAAVSRGAALDADEAVAFALEQVSRTLASLPA